MLVPDNGSFLDDLPAVERKSKHATRQKDPIIINTGGLCVPLFRSPCILQMSSNSHNTYFITVIHLVDEDADQGLTLYCRRLPNRT